MDFCDDADRDPRKNAVGFFDFFSFESVVVVVVAVVGLVTLLAGSDVFDVVVVVSSQEESPNESCLFEFGFFDFIDGFVDF